VLKMSGAATTLRLCGSPLDERDTSSPPRPGLAQHRYVEAKLAGFSNMPFTHLRVA